jgi:hypothetical protein
MESQCGNGRSGWMDLAGNTVRVQRSGRRAAAGPWAQNKAWYGGGEGRGLRCSPESPVTSMPQPFWNHPVSLGVLRLTRTRGVETVVIEASRRFHSTTIPVV